MVEVEGIYVFVYIVSKSGLKVTQNQQLLIGSFTRLTLIKKWDYR